MTSGPKLSEPLGSTPSLKSEAVAEDEPLTAQLTVLLPLIAPLRLTV